MQDTDPDSFYEMMLEWLWTSKKYLPSAISKASSEKGIRLLRKTDHPILQKTIRVKFEGLLVYSFVVQDCP